MGLNGVSQTLACGGIRASVKEAGVKRADKVTVFYWLEKSQKNPSLKFVVTYINTCNGVGLKSRVANLASQFGQVVGYPF